MAARWPTTATIQQALDVLNRAHTPDQPDWRILSVQGAVLDQMGRHADAQRYYASALRLDARRAVGAVQSRAVLRAVEESAARRRRRCGAPRRSRGAEPKVRQNLALVVGLQGRFQEAETIARADLSPDEAAANVAYLRQMLAQQNDWKQGQARLAAGADDGLLALPRLRFEPSLIGALRCSSRRCVAITRMAAGPRMTTNSTGRKNRIIGTVSFGGSAAAFFSASDMRMSRFSCAITRSVCAERRAVALGLLQRHADRLHAVEIGALGEVLVGLLRSCR